MRRQPGQSVSSSSRPPSDSQRSIWLRRPKVVTAGVLLLSVCPGGGISTYYTYLARANVALSALITALSTVLSLLTMPFWLSLLSKHGQTVVELKEVPIFFVMAQLVCSCCYPLLPGRPSSASSRNSSSAYSLFLRRVSFVVVLMVLGFTALAIPTDLSLLATDIGLSAVIFIVLAMLVAQLTTVGLRAGERSVVVIESAERNVGIALVLGRMLLDPADLAVVAGFLIGYFLVELVIWSATPCSFKEKIQEPWATPRQLRLTSRGHRKTETARSFDGFYFAKS